MEERCGVRMITHFFSMALDMPDGPGALCRLIFISVFAIRLGENTGNLDSQALGGFHSSNMCSSQLRGHSGGKKVLAKPFALDSLEEAVVPSDSFRSGIRCLP